MAQKHLRELLQDDQEPFQLKHYIAERRCQIQIPSTRTDLQVNKRKPISKNPSFPSNLFKNACFPSVHETTDPRKSPLFDLQSPAKSPNRVFLHVPARTAALLLEAAVRIQKQSSRSSKSKGKTRENGFGLFGSVFKRLTRRDWTPWPETGRNSVNERVGLEKDEGAYAIRSRVTRFSSSAVWSESDEEDDDNSLNCDFEPSSSSRRENFKDVDEFEYKIAEAGDFDYCEKRFCESPFRFVLQTITPNPSGDRTPNFISPATSPSRYAKEDKDSSDVDSSEKLQEEEEEDDEEEERCSPVSVLDPSFDEDGHVEDEEDGGFDPEGSYAKMQRATQRLLQKLYRFEQLAGLDPVELEKRMLEQEQEKYDGDENGTHASEEDEEEEEEEEEEELEIINESFPLDLIKEKEKRKRLCINRDVSTERVWKKLSSWKEVEFKTIHTVVGQDFRNEVDEWRRNQDQVQETALEIELAIFGLLVEELSEDVIISFN